MYQSDFICTYKYLDSKEDSNLLYQLQLLQAFNLETWVDKDNETEREIQEEIGKLYDKCKDIPEFKELLNLNMIYSNPRTEAEEIEAFTTFFSYDSFDYLHRWIGEVINWGRINPETQRQLKEQLKKNLQN